MNSNIKIFHTADWHLGDFPGPEVNNKNARAADIKAVLTQLVREAEAQKPDVIIISGDLFHQAKTWCDRALSEVRFISQILYSLSDIPSVKAVIALRGTPNHDGREYFETLKSITSFNPKIYTIFEDETVTLNNFAQIICIPAFDNSGKIAVENGVINIPENADAATRNNALCQILHQKIRRGLNTVNPDLPIILATHFTVSGCVNENGFTNITSLSEPVIDPISLIGYDLVCLGHIHKTQQAAANAYYAGSPFQLTFGDENDARGYYTHEFDNNASAFISTFHALPAGSYSREFFTLKLDNSEISTLILSNYNSDKISPEVNNKIVRVLYTCDADVHANLNKALLEKAILDAGAWHLDSIAPEEIVTLTNKTVITQVQALSPFETLKEWLATADETVLNNTDTDACLTLAEPIINKTTASMPQLMSKRQGLFTPRRIEVKNYRNYAEAQFDYKDVKFCVINGNNGAGKSSLFMDAMFDALFENPREGDIKAWLSNRPKVRSGSITFEFSIGDKIYKIVRTRTKSNSLTLNIYEINPDGSQTDLSKSNTKSTQALIESVINLDAFTLKSCGLIMQAGYDTFLQADRSARIDVLCDLLNLGIYEKLFQETASEAIEITREIAKIQAEQAVLLGNSESSEIIADIPALEANLKNLQTQEATLLADKKDCEIRALNLKAAIAEIGTLTKKITELTKAANELTLEHNALNSQLSGLDIAALETVYNEHVKNSEREKFLTSQSAIQKLLIGNKAASERALFTISQDIANTSTQIANARQQSSDENIAKLKSAVDILESVSLKETELTACQNERNTLYEQYQSKKAIFDASCKPLQSQIDGLTAEIERLRNSGCLDFDNANCEFIKAAKTAPAEIRKLYDSMTALTVEFNSDAAKISNLSDICDKKAQVIITWLSSALPDRSRLNDDIKRTRAELAAAEAAVTNLTQLTERLNALTVNKQEHETAVQNTLAELTKIRESCDVQNDSDLDSLIVDIKAAIAASGKSADLFAQLPVLKEKRDNIEKTLAKTISDIESSEREIKIKQLENPNYEISLQTLDEAIITVNENLLNNARERGALEAAIKIANENQARVAKMADRLADLSKLEACYDLLKIAFSRHGITHNIIRKIIPEIENVANQILNAMTGNVLSVRFVLDKTLKTKKEVVTLDVVIDDNRPGGTGSLAYLSRSGGEKVKASLAVILALAELKASQNGIQLGFLFIDEPPFLDASGISAYCDALDVIGRRYPALKIMAITHDENMKSRFPQHIAVIKENDGSHFSTDIYGAFSNNAAQERKEYLEQSEPIKRSRRTKTATA